MKDQTTHFADRVAMMVSSALTSFPRSFYRRYTQISIEAIFSAISVWIAFNLRFDFQVPAWAEPSLYFWMLIASMFRPATMLAFGAYRSIWRYFNHHDALIFLYSSSPLTIVLLLLRMTLAHRSWVAAIPYTVIFMEFGVFVALGGLIRSIRRATYEMASGRVKDKLRALVIGTEHTLPGALRHTSSDPQIEVVGVIAPQQQLHGFRIGGFDVVNTPAELGKLLTQKNVNVILIADPNMETLSHTVATATEFGVDIRLLPSASSVISGEVRVAAPPSVDSAFMERGIALAATAPEVLAAFNGRNVLVSGAGGSIGSEICRQLMNLAVSSVILLDQDENSIFERNNELRALGKETTIVPLVGDIRDEERLRRIFSTYRPHIVLHAAAYKHVPVMEANCSEAILNNIAGTRLLAEVSSEFEAERFLMISTDKAVNPTSVMGASKRVAEAVVQGLAIREKQRRGHTRFSCVRFGNVAGSRGSVVPIFLKQIAAGEPLTITDEAMTRYFMTIPEAVQLVLQACSLGEQGDIYMLDMGDPIKIKNLAIKLIEMSGLRPEKDIEIKVVGIRPGEKLHEELWSKNAVIRPTSFSRVFCIEAEPPASHFDPALIELESQAREGNDAEVKRRLFDLLAPRAAQAAAGKN